MALNTPVSGITYAELTDIPNMQTATQNLALSLDTKVIPKFASATARDAAITAPVDGQLIYRTDLHAYQTYNTSVWRFFAHVICTSGTRPSSPAVGMLIFETDTLVQLTYNGAAWQMTAPYKRIITVTSNGQRPILFSGIPSTLRSLTLKYTARGSVSATATTADFSINGVTTGGQYFGQYVSVINTTSTPNVVTGGNTFRVGALPGASAAAGLFGVGVVEVMGWNSPHTKINFLARSNFYDVASNSFTEYSGGLFNVAGPYTSIQIDNAGGFAIGSEFVLEGWD